MEFYKKHRPTLFKQLVGQPDAVRVLTGMVKKKTVPHAILLTGPSGCGKTTIARILRDKLECHDRAFSEINCADFRGIDMVREIRKFMGQHTLSGKCRIYLIDECHQLTGEAQNALLKMLEDTPSHVYFMLATTDPGKLKTTIKTRCTEIKVRGLLADEMKGLLQSVAKKESLTIGDDVYDKIIDVAEGSARKALVLLDQISAIEDEQEQLEAIEASDSKRQGIEIARALMRVGKDKCSWSEMCKLLKEIDEEPETIRHIVLGYMTSVMLGGSKISPRCYAIIQCFRDNWYDCKRAGLVAACYEVINTP